MVCCRKNKLWERHLGIQKYLSRCLTSFGQPHILERQVTPTRPLRTDLSLLRWENNVDLELDVAVCHSTPPLVDDPSITSGSNILAQRVARKVLKYQDLCRNQHRSFTPFVVTAWGKLDTASFTVWKEIVRRCVLRVGGPARARGIEVLHQGLSAALHHGVAKQLQSLALVLEAHDPVHC